MAGGDDDRDSSLDRRTATRAALVIGAIALVAATVAIVVVARDRTSLQGEVDRLTTKLEIARGDAGAEIAGLEREVEVLEADLAEARTSLELTAGELDDVTTRLATATEQIDERDDELATERELVAELEAQLQLFEDLVGADAVAMPDFLGSDLDVVEAFADEVGAALLVEEADPTNVIGRPGSVIEQLPEPDVVVAPGSVIWIQLFAPGSEPE